MTESSPNYALTLTGKLLSLRLTNCSNFEQLVSHAVSLGTPSCCSESTTKNCSHTSKDTVLNIRVPHSLLSFSGQITGLLVFPYRAFVSPYMVKQTEVKLDLSHWKRP